MSVLYSIVWYGIVWYGMVWLDFNEVFFILTLDQIANLNAVVGYCIQQLSANVV